MRLSTFLLATALSAGTSFGANRVSTLEVPASAIVRTALTGVEQTEVINISVALKMRNMDELHARIQSGQLVSQDEMEAKYLPLKSDYDQVASWLASRGLTIRTDLVDSNHTNVLVRGTVAAITNALQVKFGKVIVAGTVETVTSALTEPVIDAAINTKLVGVNGLQRHYRAKALDGQGVITFEPNLTLTPTVINTVYHNSSSLTGAGQTVAVYGWATPATSDLSGYINLIGSGEALSNYTVIPVDGGPTAAEQSNADYLEEATGDVDLVMGVAPGAKIRLYAPSADTSAAVNDVVVAVINDQKADKSITVFSLSYGLPEDEMTKSTLDGMSQLFAQLAAAGVTVCAGSGDGGSNPGAMGFYLPSNPLTAEWPAVDPSVTGVGETDLTFPNLQYPGGFTNWIETVDNNYNPAYTNANASGGGVSTYFPRPVWQTGTGVPAANNRCVPDVSMVGGAYTSFVNGKLAGFAGTSASCPAFAGYMALANQARANAGWGPLGILGPKIYPLLGSSAFTDITSGNNGAYSAGPGYDMASGIGSPNFDALFAVLAPSSSTSGSARIVNISSRAFVSTGAGQEIAGFVISGSGTEQVLVRIVGPGLSAFGVTGVLAQPTITLYDSKNNVVASNTVWGSSSASSQITAADAAVGAFALTQGSADSALIATLAPGSYTAIASGVGSTTGNALLEVYEVAASGTRAVNISTRAFIGTGASVLIAGFVIEGTGTEQVLIRGDGPALTGFGVSGALAQTQVTVYDSNSNVVATNSGWSNNANAAQIASTSATLGAFALTQGSGDSALLLTLPPGSYTVQVAGVSNQTGNGLVEVYEVPAQ